MLTNGIFEPGCYVVRTYVMLITGGIYSAANILDGLCIQATRATANTVVEFMFDSCAIRLATYNVITGHIILYYNYLRGTIGRKLQGRQTETNSEKGKETVLRC